MTSAPAGAPPKKKLPSVLIGFVAGLAVLILILMLPMQQWGLNKAGQVTLAFTLCTVVWWALNIAQNGYVSAVYLAALAIYGTLASTRGSFLFLTPEQLGVNPLSNAPLTVPTAATIFGAWTGQTMWLVIGAYLIAGAVKSSGLGERIAYAFLLKFVSGYRSIIISIYVLTFILSLLIPHPWPRAFLIMSVMGVIIASAKIPKIDAIKIGFTVFAASVPVSLIFLTGDAVINPLAVAQAASAARAAGITAPINMNWTQWLLYMGPPSIVVSIITCVLNLFLFKASAPVSVNKDEIKTKLDAMGKMTQLEIRTIIWLAIAVVLWMTSIFPLGYATLIVAGLMAFPYIGGVLKPSDWSGVPIQVLLFLTAAIAIGVVGGATGMNAWIAKTLLPANAPTNLFILAAMICLIAIVIHMLLGSVIAVMGVAVPAIVAFTAPTGLNPLVPTMLVYMAIAAHYMLPFQHLNMLVGASPDTGGFTQKETLKLGTPLIAVMFFTTIVIMVPWFMITGLPAMPQ